MAALGLKDADVEAPATERPPDISVPTRFFFCGFSATTASECMDAAAAQPNHDRDTKQTR